MRRILGLLDEFQIPDSELLPFVDSFYLYDFPAQFRSLKLKDILSFHTIQNIDTYSFDSEAYTTVEMPCYCMKREIKLFTNQWSFFGANYNWQFQTNIATGNGTAGPYSGTASNSPIIRSYNTIPLTSQDITNIVVDSPSVGTVTVHFTTNSFNAGQNLFFGDIEGTVGSVMNGVTFPVVTSGSSSLTITLAATGLTYTSGGKAFLTPLNFNFPASKINNLLITAPDTNNSTMNVTDDGFGNLQGDVTAGTVNYQTGAVSNLTFTNSVQQGGVIQMQFNPIVPSIPLAILFFQNQFVLRPVPDKGYTIELTAYRSPTQALVQTPDQAGKPELTEWWETIAIGAAKKYYEDQLDFENIALLDKLLAQKYALNNTRTYAQIGKQRVGTIYADQLSLDYGSSGWGFGNGGSGT